MDIMASYYSVKNRVMQKVNPPSDWRVFSYKAPPASEGQRIRVNEMRRQDTIEQHERDITRLNHEVEHLKAMMLAPSVLSSDEVKGQDAKTSIPTYDNYDQILNRVKEEITESVKNCELYDKFITKAQVYVYLDVVCDGLETEISEILSGRQEQAEQELASDYYAKKNCPTYEVPLDDSYYESKDA